jgi:hypothetical protein
MVQVIIQAEKTLYVCEICDKAHTTSEEAGDCEEECEWTQAMEE